jgi:hypothetical protein
MNWTSSKLKMSCTKRHIKKVKGQHIEWKKIFTHLEIVSKIYKGFLQLINKKTTQSKMDKEFKHSMKKIYK